MMIADPLGVPGAPLETLGALQTRFEGADLSGGRLVLITDCQGHRDQAGYAALVVTGKGQGATAVLTAPAFGPRYGHDGPPALAELVRWAQGQGLPVTETVLNPSDFERVLAEPDAYEVARLLAASNPCDPLIYTRPARPTQVD